jgi:[acyl-carrier-protein] S-malonyltransferase
MDQKPRSVFLFPGMNSLLHKADRFRYLRLQEVQARIDQAEQILRDHRRIPFPLRRLLDRPTQEIYSLENIHFTTILICSMQLGIADRLREILPAPEWVVGCSLGDIARSVYAGSVHFEHILEMIHRVADARASVARLGACIVLLKPAKFDRADLRWLEEQGISVCRLSERRLILAGNHATLAAVRGRGNEKKWKSLFLIDCPFHSPCLAPQAATMAPLMDVIPFQDPQRRVFSSLLLKPISKAEELRSEHKMALVQPFDWCETTRRLVKDIGITRFINIGPCQSLLNLVRDIAPDQEILDAEEIIQGVG